MIRDEIEEKIRFERTLPNELITRGPEATNRLQDEFNEGTRRLLYLTGSHRWTLGKTSMSSRGPVAETTIRMEGTLYRTRDAVPPCKKFVDDMIADRIERTAEQPTPPVGYTRYHVTNFASDDEPMWLARELMDRLVVFGGSVTLFVLTDPDLAFTLTFRDFHVGGPRELIFEAKRDILLS